MNFRKSLFLALSTIAFNASAGDLNFSSKARTETPQVVVKTSDKVVTLTKNNTVTIRGPIDGASMSQAIVELSKNTSANPILYISSPGGDVIEGLRLVQYILDSDRKITCYAETAVSMAFVIFQACHERLVGDASLLMQHQASAQVAGSAEILKSRVNSLFDMIGKLEKAQSDRIGISLEEFRKRVANEWYTLGTDAVKGGLADRMVSVRCDSEIVQETVAQTVFTMFGPVELTYSRCPVASSPLSISLKNIFDPTKQSDAYKAVMKPTYQAPSSTLESDKSK